MGELTTLAQSDLLVGWGGEYPLTIAYPFDAYGASFILGACGASL